MALIYYCPKLIVDPATGRPAVGLKGAVGKIVARGDTATSPEIYEDAAGSAIIAGSELTVTDDTFVRAFYVDEEFGPVSFWGSGVEVPLETTEGIAILLGQYRAETDARLDDVEATTGEAVTAAQAAQAAAEAAQAAAEDAAAGGGGGGGGVTDHGALSGLTDDDHTQYHTDARGDARYVRPSAMTAAISAAVSTASSADRDRANHSGTQAIGTVDGLGAALTSRAQFVVVATGAEARPSGSTVVVWLGGTTEPTNMSAGDYWWKAVGSETPADVVAPSVPTGLATSGVGATSLTASWSPSTDNVGVTGYEVRRDGAFSAGTTSGTSLVVTGLTQLTAYTFQVRARDANANWSAWSSSVSATTAASSDATPPSTPTGLSSSAITATGFTVSWTASTDNVAVTGYRVLIGGVEYATPSGTSQVVTGRTASTAYSVTVQARDAAGNWSGVSSALSVTTIAGSVVEHTVFGAADPRSTITWAGMKKTDGSPNLLGANAFYLGASGTTGWSAVGGRVYVPSGISMASTASVKAWLTDNYVTPDLSTTPDRTATISSSSSGWREGRWSTPLVIPSGKSLWIGVDFGDGTYLGEGPSTLTPVQALDGSAVYLAENGHPRAVHRIGSGSTTVTGGGNYYFGIDAIIREA